jgi:hypothetical protein
MAHLMIEVGKTYLSRNSKVVKITKERSLARYKFQGDNGLPYTKYGKSRYPGDDLVMTKAEADKINKKAAAVTQPPADSPVRKPRVKKSEGVLPIDELRPPMPPVAPPSTQKTVKVNPDLTHVTLNLDKRQTPLKIDINQNGRITTIIIPSDYDSPLVQS